MYGVLEHNCDRIFDHVWGAEEGQIHGSQKGASDRERNWDHHQRKELALKPEMAKVELEDVEHVRQLKREKVHYTRNSAYTSLGQNQTGGWS